METTTNIKHFFVFCFCLTIAWLIGVYTQSYIDKKHFEEYKLTACKQQHESYLNYRNHADNRIGLLENYLEHICYNLGYQNFIYDKENLWTSRAKCTDKFIGKNSWGENLTINEVYLINYKIRDIDLTIPKI